MSTLRTENAYLKKLKELDEGRRLRARKKQKLLEKWLRVSFRYTSRNYQRCSFNLLLSVKTTEIGTIKIKRSKGEIQAIYYEHKGNYGYRRITFELRNRGFVINQKKVQRLMKALGLSSQIRRKRKYSSYQGEVGKKADNLIQRQFEASKPLEKCYTDVTEFAIPASTKTLFIASFRWLQ